MRRKLESKTKKPSFFKVLMKNFHQQLRVPRAFLKHFNGKLPKKCVLRISSTSSSSTAGRSSLSSTRINYNYWTIKMKKIASGRGANYREDVIFSSGWPEFVNHHCLELKDFLIFAYKGKSEFKVEMYGRNGCIKDHHSENKGYEDDQPMSLSNTIKIEEEEEEEEGALQRHWAHDGQRKASKAWEMVRGNKVRGASTEYSFSVIWRHPENLIIPRVWAEKMKGLENRKSIVLLKDPNGRSWPVSFHPHKDGRIDMKKGWAEFSIGNGLTEGDTCSFNFTEKMRNYGADNYEMNVDIIRKNAKNGETKEFKRSSSSCRFEKKQNFTKRSIAKNTTMAHNAKASGLLVPTKQGASKSAIKLLDSANTSFWIMMRSSYVTSAWGYLPIPNTFAKTFLRDGSQRLTLKVNLDGSWRTWDVICNSTGCNTRLSRLQKSGWMKFVSDNRLEEGDVCIFEIVDLINLEFNVTIGQGKR